MGERHREGGICTEIGDKMSEGFRGKDGYKGKEGWIKKRYREGGIWREGTR